MSPMKPILFVGVALIISGAAILGYGHYTYTTRETVLQVGPLKATAEREHTETIPPIIGWILVGGGICAIAFGALSKKS